MSPRQEAIWAAYDEHCEALLGDTFADLELTEFDYVLIKQRANELLGKGSKGRLAVRHIRDALMAHKSPFVDSVAVGRALDFDWPVIDALTREESRVVYRALGAMEDPYEQGPDPLARYLSTVPGTTDTGAEARPTSGRRMNWMEGSRAQRTRVSQGVGRVAKAEGRAA